GPPERVGRLQPRIEGGEDGAVELGSSEVRDVVAAVTVIDGGEEPAGHDLHRPAIFHVSPGPAVGGEADSGRDGPHGLGWGGSRRGLPAHSETESSSSMMT